ncbi:C-GCAxxG-C-C family protein [Limisalsivibrio acetivorans]|uniref:C-GCAxxG-C-C family protein n=1 Tax=Limisalsivibrio acetivorans TaxID=1304888 RepID=UPI0003B69D28|nr:C-GCAxxG-C-C family (seleno)protein [Limisalsivibrio acetivorans]
MQRANLCADEVIQTYADEAFRLFKDGYYCSEAVTITYEKALGVEFPDELKKAMTALVEGIGATGCICGALNASVILLSSRIGRTDNITSPARTEKLSAEIMKGFKQEMGATCCRTIKKSSSKAFGIGQYRSCRRCIDTAVKLLLNISCRENII